MSTTIAIADVLQALFVGVAIAALVVYSGCF